MHNPLTTEAHNPASAEIDRLSALEIVRLMNAEDARVAEAVASQAEAIAGAIDAIAERLRKGGRLIYLGAGTSGRLGVLDASECPPTFNSPPEQVVGLIAGGPAALTRAIEGAEDKPELAIEDLRRIQLVANDAVVGIATSGRTPYVIAGLQFARERGALTIAFSCNSDSQVASQADLAITPVVGPEVISGSTRLKAGTATKLVLNMLSTGAMVRIGKTFGNLMVDLRATNSKLRARTIRIAEQLAGLGEGEAQKLLDRCDGELKTAVVAARCKIAPAEARRRLTEAGGHLRKALGSVNAGAMPSPAPVDVGMDGADQQRPRASLVLGIDGGGTKTLALLASASDDSLRILGRGAAGPANPQVVGFAGAALALDEAVRRAFADASLEPAPVDAACLALAGAGRDSDRRQMERWAAERNLAQKFSQVHDALPVLAAGTPEGWGVAVIAGTGSLVYGQDRDGRTARAGGWGHLFGDEGSGYAIALDALRAVARAADGRGPATILQDKLLAKLDGQDPHDLVPAIYARKPDRREIAALAALVSEAAQEGDAVALAILRRAADELAECVQAVRDRLAFGDTTLPIALAGGVLLAAPPVRELLMARLREIGIAPGPVERVDEPALGAVKLAAKLSSAV